VGIEAIVSPYLEENCYLLSAVGGRDAVVVDPGVGTAEAVHQLIVDLGLNPAGIVMTHGHPDHLWDAAAASQMLGVPVYLHIRDAHYLEDPFAGLARFGLPRLSQFAGDGSSAVWRRPSEVDFVETAADGGATLALGALTFRALACPGHTPGSTVFEVAGVGTEPILLTGDVLFHNGVGRTDLPGGDQAAMRASLGNLIRAFDPGRIILPGHGPGSTLGREIASSPYLAEALEV
jgi:glyoxylase-like metal-dependent hydrolase (beta-lactamase superfamily II)